ncbi:bifunctional 4-hydroxy-2-oxoglutarate aldolase/2-dehydro-3-deoxy-phosphogluconate aldolase [Pedobacter sp. HMF7647]|uniref:Bifunctional 4-hydroxy-2-oxoglutarate aldolase/2-dehydro-3-deoxy-phosphogluconate aldolase n=1 Tax=Hufsiella arboris TaxID=2695275 RepID=A0A7K1Y630_9SPHI|nr:bifunctional 4-hydroxy-2-oxoglutarate aldolase/2-dehydro-3-deoxy-phosphogluconate aldolase [Hufsiella arboris]MXV49478.1 bifunctional 4-hydroxy-2-oxoglutarate aldolase/2-dehydro-3-deoxy-phosphogluconate aldolase [Hufsiella arboris]
MKDQIVEAIIKQGMLPLFYQDSGEDSVEILRALYKAGVRVFEYTNRGTKALENFSLLKKVRDAEMTDLFLGIGTIKSKQEALDFIAAGVDFIVAPIINPEVGELCNQRGMLWIPGCMTPSEIFLAQQHQAAIIKIFPANILGAEFISSIRELFIGQKFIPTGGVEVEAQNISKWFKAGVCAVGMGSKLISKDVIENKKYDELYQNTKLALQLVSENRN